MRKGDAAHRIAIAVPDVDTRPELGKRMADTDSPPNIVTTTLTKPGPLRPVTVSVTMTMTVTLAWTGQRGRHGGL